jgi:hypothetical protein
LNGMSMRSRSKMRFTMSFWRSMAFRGCLVGHGSDMERRWWPNNATLKTAAKKGELVQEAGYFWSQTSLERFRIVAQFMIWVSGVSTACLACHADFDDNSCLCGTMVQSTQWIPYCICADESQNSTAEICKRTLSKLRYVEGTR